MLPGHPGILKGYYRCAYTPLQIIRGYIAGYIPFNIGDALYVLAGAWLAYTLYKIIASALYKSTRKNVLPEVLNVANFIAGAYVIFIVGWGGNYYQPPLRQVWALTRQDSLQLETFDSILVTRLNTLATGYRTLNLAEVNERAANNYKSYTSLAFNEPALRIKYSYFGYFLERLAIEGYYNPFTGEGQISGRLPAFMLPFVVSHEMAHQAGIAAEGDANLMAYAVSTLSTDTSFLYSANLNLWLYVNTRLSRRDSAAAAKWEKKLNPLSQAHADTLAELSKLYDNEASRYSSEMYDNYLKLQQQKEGIKSYGNVTYNAWLLEQERRKNTQAYRILKIL